MMKTGSAVIWSVLLLANLPAWAGTTNAAPPFAEVYELLQKNLTGTSPVDLNRAAVEGLLRQLDAKAALEGSGAAVSNRLGVVRTNIFNSTIAYLRLDSIQEATAGDLRAAMAELAKSNKVAGLALDLRYAEGENYPAAAALADVFITREMPLLEWEGATIKSKRNSEDITIPVVVLVNHQTSGAAELTAALIREAGVGLLIGGQTAGNAAITKAFPLSTGDRLRIAVAPIKLADGQPLGSQGLAPDILVTVSPQDERAYYADAFRDSPRLNPASDSGVYQTNAAAGTNRPPRRRYSEAELVRDRREGGAEESPGRGVEPETPLVRDPALARAIDLLKGLAVVRAPRP